MPMPSSIIRIACTRPYIRKNGKLVEATWDEALTLVAEKLGAIKAESGPDSIAIPYLSQVHQRRKLPAPEVCPRGDRHE